jgi:hypothetical protein
LGDGDVDIAMDIVNIAGADEDARPRQPEHAFLSTVPGKVVG